MKQITIGFSRASTSFPIFSWAIMAVQHTNYSHVYLKYVDSTLNQVTYFQASHTLVNYMSEATFLAQETVVKEFTFNISDAAFVAWLQFAHDNAGLPYGVKEVCGLAIADAAMAVGIKMDNPFKDAGSTWVCNQLITAGLQKCENITLPMPIDDMMPKDTYALVSSLPTTLS